MGPGYTVTEAYRRGSRDVVLVGPTTWVTQDVLTFAEVANDLTKTTTSSGTPQPWDNYGLLHSNNTSLVESFLSYGRGPACTSDFLSYAAANPSLTQTAKSVTTITLPNGQATAVVVYTTYTESIGLGNQCCGRCSIFFNNLQMLYWPAAHPNTACLVKTSAGLNSTSTSVATAGLDQSMYATDSDGFIL